MTTEGSTKFVNFMTNREGILVLCVGHIGDIAKMLYFIKIFFSTPVRRADQLNYDEHGI